MQQTALERQQVGRWLAGFFLAEPDLETLRFYRTAEGAAALDRLDGIAGLADLVGALRELAGAGQQIEAIRLDLAAAYGRLFLVGGPASVPLHASAYLDDGGRLMQEPARETEAILRRLDLSLPPGFNEPADHIGVQLSILAELATADGTDLPDEAAYLERYLLPWVPTLAALCKRLSPSPFYRGLAGATLGWLRQLDAGFAQEK